MLLLLLLFLTLHVRKYVTASPTLCVLYPVIPYQINYYYYCGAVYYMRYLV